MSSETLTRRTALLGAGAASLALLGACGSTARTAAPAAPTPTVAPDAIVTARGSFEGRSDHVTTGHARILRSNGQWLVELEDDFFFDGAPDPKVALGNQGYDADTILSPLRTDQGRQAYALKAGLDIGDYTQVWIWCERFNVPLGVAELTLV